MSQIESTRPTPIPVAVKNKPAANAKPQQALVQQTHDPAHAQATNLAAQEGALSYSDLYSIADNLSAVMAQFKRTSQAEKNKTKSTDPYERILEEDSESGIDKLQIISKSAEFAKENFLQFARSMFPDDTDLILVLRELIRRRKIGNIDTTEFEELLDQVWENTDKKQTQAGLNVALKSRLFSKKMRASAKALRESYRHFLTSEESELFQYEELIEQYGHEKRHVAIDYIETALLNDIQSHDPSCSKLEFGSLLSHVVTFKKIKASEMAFCHAFLRNNIKFLLLENELLKCWFDCVQRPLKIKKEIEKNDMNNLAAILPLSKEIIRQKLLVAIKQIDDVLFLDAEIKLILTDTLLKFQPANEHKK